MMLRLIRNATHGKSVIGELYMLSPLPLQGERMPEGQERGYKIADTLENADYLIPELIYPVHVTHSPKFGRLLPLIDHVPGRSGIRMHAGNRATDSQGCVLLGRHPHTPSEEGDVKQGYRLMDSRLVVSMVTKLLLSVDTTREEIRIDVTHYEPEYPGYQYTDYNPHHAAYSEANTVIVDPED